MPRCVKAEDDNNKLHEISLACFRPALLKQRPATLYSRPRTTLTEAPAKQTMDFMRTELKHLIPQTSSKVLCCIVVLVSGLFTVISITSIVMPLSKYNHYAYYYVKVYWPEFILPALQLWFAISLWRLRRWTRSVLLLLCWFLAIVFPPIMLAAPELDLPLLWNEQASLTENLTHSPLILAYTQAAISLFVIHILQIRKCDFQAGF